MWHLHSVVNTTWLGDSCTCTKAEGHCKRDGFWSRSARHISMMRHRLSRPPPPAPPPPSSWIWPAADVVCGQPVIGQPVGPPHPPLINKPAAMTCGAPACLPLNCCPCPWSAGQYLWHPRCRGACLLPKGCAACRGHPDAAD